MSANTSKAALGAAILIGCGGAHPARAVPFISPFATAGIERDSNVFMRPTNTPLFVANGITTLADTIETYEGGLDSEFDWGRDTLTLDGDALQENYDRFSFLDHYEYRLAGDLDWHLGPVVETELVYNQSRFMAPFTETLALGLFVDTQRVASAMVRVLVTPKWRVDLTPGLDQIDTPLPGFPDFRRSERTGTAGLDYLGFGRLTAGLQLEYIQGHYSGIVRATRYTQRDADVTASYQLSGLSELDASVGYTRRGTEANPTDSLPATPANSGYFGGFAGAVGTVSGVNGTLDYKRQITGKTSGTLSLYRHVQSYTGSPNPEISTGGAIGAEWVADAKITVDLDYSLAQNQIQGGLVAANFVNRTDRVQHAAFDVRYLAISWLTIRPYVNWEHSSSSFTLGNYSATIVGIDVTGRLRW